MEENKDDSSNDETIVKITLEKMEFKCEICEMVLSSKRNLDWHMLNICKYEHICSKCNKCFNSSNYLKRHESICIGILECPKCKKVLSRKQTYLKHINICFGE